MQIQRFPLCPTLAGDPSPPTPCLPSASGERDEQVEELIADLADVKCMYKDQIEFMCYQLLELQGGYGAGGPSGAHGHGVSHGHGPGAHPAAHGAPGRPPVAAAAADLTAGLGPRVGAGRRGSQTGDWGAG